MELEYLDNTSSKSVKAHDLYYRALQKPNQTAKKPKQKKSTKIKQQTAVPFSEQISCWAQIRQWQSKQNQTNQVIIWCHREQPYTMISAPL